jgi:hypothetical protein
MFIGVLIHLAWVLVVVGVSLATPQLGMARWLGPGLLIVAGGVSTALMALDVKLKALAYLSLLLAPGFPAMDVMLILPPNDAASHFRSTVISSCPMIRRAILLATALASLMVEPLWWKAALFTTLAALDAAGSARLHLLAGLSFDRRCMPKLSLVRQGSDKRCTFSHAGSLKEGFVSLTLTSHAGLAVCTAHDDAGAFASVPLAIGPICHALRFKLTYEGMLTTDSGAVMHGYDGPRKFVEGNNMRLHVEL